MQNQKMKTQRDNSGCALAILLVLFGLPGLILFLQSLGSLRYSSVGACGILLGLGMMTLPFVVYRQGRSRAPAESKSLALRQALPLDQDFSDFLLKEIRNWREEGLISAELFEKLLSRYQPTLAAPEPVAPPAVAKPMPESVQPAPLAPTLPTPEPVPFIEWLLSPRNIRIALYSGASLLVMAGIIFVGSRWGEFSGAVKQAIMVAATGLLYAAGYLLYRRRGLRVGGVAILGVASGFLPLNFAVLQIYLLDPQGFRWEVMWLIASVSSLLVYLPTTLWTRAGLFTYFSAGALYSAVAAGLEVGKVPLEGHPLAYLALAEVLLILARRLQETKFSEFTRLPLLIIVHAVAPLLVAAALLGFVLGSQPSMALAGMYAGVLFYITTDALLGWGAARWAAAGLFPLAVTLTLGHLGFSDRAIGIAQMVLAVAYLAGGYFLERTQKRRAEGVALYAFAYVLALFVTYRATFSYSFALLQAPREAGYATNLILALLGDVVILTISFYIFRHYAWVYGTVWLFMLPIYLFVEQAGYALPDRGIFMSGLGLGYVVVGYALSRNEVREGALVPVRGGPFLSAAAFLSVAVVVLSWGSPVIVTSLLVAIAILYLGVALWLQWPELIFAALLAVDLGVFTTQEIFLGYGVADMRILALAYAVLAILLALAGLSLRRGQLDRWAIPLYAVSALNLAGSYVVSLRDRPLAIGLSAIFATLLLAYSWLERVGVKRVIRSDIPVLTYAGLGTIVIGSFYVLDIVSVKGVHLLRDWPVFIAALCGIFVAASWRLGRGEPARIYGVPLRWTGLGLTALPMAGALYSQRPLLVAATFAIIGLAYCGEALARRLVYLAYGGAASFLVTYWALLDHFGVEEYQAYVLPAGLGLLVLGWNERSRGQTLIYQWSSLLGVAILLGSSFWQSLPRGQFIYALWLGVESLAAVGWGVAIRSRGFVSLGVLALVGNSIVQFGPAFVEMPRWFQLASTGGILLGGGIFLLIKRQQVLGAWRTFSEDWN